MSLRPPFMRFSPSTELRQDEFNTTLADMATSQQLLDKAIACIDWYWAHGILRTDRWELQRGTWLDKIYRCRNVARALVEAEQVPRPCMALWGPSQTGKSTLLSGYIDKEDDDLGLESALTWHQSDPVRFVIGKDKSSRITVLNPFNQGADASGCVSRFSARDQVPDPLHPVEIVLATNMQILHALAVGYLSECEPKNAKDEQTSWDSDSINALVERLQPSGAPSHPTREGFEFLQSLAETIDLLVMSEVGRYPSLKVSWESEFRGKLLRSPYLQSSVEQAEKFAFEFLWDSWKSLTDTYRRLAAKRKVLATQFGNRPVRCSYKVACLLLDIDAYRKAAENPDVMTAVSSIRYRIDGDCVVLDVGGEGSPLVTGQEDFGLTQGLVWELHFSLKRSVLTQRAPILEAFFATADLMDFPGVANEGRSAEPHDDKKVGGDLKIALTQVLKRGKTASIVVTRARNLDIDGFSLLMRLGRYPSQCPQLMAGIKSWLDAYGHPIPPQGKPMPINLVMTFCAHVVNQVIQAGARHGLKPCFDQAKTLGWLVDPKHVTSIATTYPQFYTEGALHGTDEEKQIAMDSIINDPAFNDRFGDSSESFRQMAANGGTDYFFNHLANQAKASQRKVYVAQRLCKTVSDLCQKIADAAPGEGNALDERNRAIDAWAAALDTKLREPRRDTEMVDPVTKLSAGLRTFVNIDGDEMDDIPVKAISARVPIRPFIDKQIRNWQSRRGDWPGLETIGIADGAEAQKVLGYLVEGAAVELVAVETFFKDELGELTSRADSKQSRRYLAHALSNALLGGRASHGNVKSAQALLERLALAEDTQDDNPENSPHYVSVIAPFLRLLEALKSKGTKDRPDQPGDKEILVIMQMP